MSWWMNDGEWLLGSYDEYSYYDDDDDDDDDGNEDDDSGDGGGVLHYRLCLKGLIRMTGYVRSLANRELTSHHLVGSKCRWV